jgi:hypothetical protein
MAIRIDDAGRECLGRCGDYKPWEDFYPGKAAHGRESRRKQCRKDERNNQPADVRQRRRVRDSAYHKTEEGKAVLWRAKLRFVNGITEEQYVWLLVEQEGVCFLCGLEERRRHYETGELTRLIPDHDHECEQGHPSQRSCVYCIRGLLDHSCNRLIGIVERSPRLAERFADYLARRPLLGEGAPQ